MFFIVALLILEKTDVIGFNAKDVSNIVQVIETVRERVFIILIINFCKNNRSRHHHITITISTSIYILQIHSQ